MCFLLNSVLELLGCKVLGVPLKSETASCRAVPTTGLVALSAIFRLLSFSFSTSFVSPDSNISFPMIQKKLAASFLPPYYAFICILPHHWVSSMLWYLK